MRILASQADVLLFQEHGSWLKEVATLALLCLHLTRHSCDSDSNQQL
ncbi:MULTISPECIES: hypothetical protein [Streptomyces]|uniref:Transposase n=1 Tax=Streptomyces ramulosus TaxID=47762 RepID=A0ABW1FTY6_9ACTN